MRSFTIVMVLLFLLTGCSAGLPSNGQPSAGSAGHPVVKSEPSATALPGQSGSTGATPTGGEASSNGPSASQPTSTPEWVQSSGSLTVQLFSESDVVVSTDKYLVAGRAPAGTVLSVNDDILIVDKSQAFNVWVPLDDGPNLIEIGASDIAGDEVDFIVTVTYNPPG